MERLRNLYFNLKPVFDIYLFEIKLYIKKFIIFSIVTILLLIMSSFLPYILFPYLSIFPNSFNNNSFSFSVNPTPLSFMTT